jgi:hypothetical protein
MKDYSPGSKGNPFRAREVSSNATYWELSLRPGLLVIRPVFGSYIPDFPFLIVPRLQDK